MCIRMTLLHLFIDNLVFDFHSRVVMFDMEGSDNVEALNNKGDGSTTEVRRRTTTSIKKDSTDVTDRKDIGGMMH